MSSAFQSEPQSNFPESVDLIDRMMDLESGDMAIVNEYNRLMSIGNINAAQQLLAQRPQLTYKIFNAFRFNHLRDAIITLQRYFLACAFTQVRGIWDSSTAYALGEMVSFQNALWQAQSANINSMPSDSSSDWQKILSVDLNGAIIDGGSLVTLLLRVIQSMDLLAASVSNGEPIYTSDTNRLYIGNTDGSKTLIGPQKATEVQNPTTGNTVSQDISGLSASLTALGGSVSGLEIILGLAVLADTHTELSIFLRAI